MTDLSDNRKSYELKALAKEELSLNPIFQFDRWYQDAEKAHIDEPNAMTIATSTPDGQPSARTVLLKGFDKNGFIFYTNYTSQKGQDLSANPRAELLFWWKELERQVRISGEVEKVAEDVSKSYFQSRPRASQISAWASPQSQEIKEHYLSDKRIETEEQYADDDNLPLPPHWGGYRVKPSVIEFWQGRANRYHDRFRYRLSDDGSWQIVRLAP